jgi:hypothetical protein
MVYAAVLDPLTWPALPVRPPATLEIPAPQSVTDVKFSRRTSTPAAGTTPEAMMPTLLT